MENILNEIYPPSNGFVEIKLPFKILLLVNCICEFIRTRNCEFIRRKYLENTSIVVAYYHSANEFAVTGANEFANTVTGANEFANTVTGANEFANTVTGANEFAIQLMSSKILNGSFISTNP